MDNNTQSTSRTVHSARVQTELEMRQSLEKTNQPQLNSRPENTKRAYEPKIEEYRRWCDSKYAHESF